MIYLSFFVASLWTDILTEPFRISYAEVEHHQVYVRATMAVNGLFAVAWIDSLKLPVGFDLNLFIRYYDENGYSMTEPYRIIKTHDSNWIYHPFIDMDSVGNSVLIWGENSSDGDSGYIRSQSFKPDGTPSIAAQSIFNVGLGVYTPISVSLSNNKEFAIALPEGWLPGQEGYGIWVQRFGLEGIPKDSVFLARAYVDQADSIRSKHPRIALNDAGDLAVTWINSIVSGHVYPMYQVFDIDDKPILPWEPKGYRLDNGDSLAGACRPEPFWIDNDRFVVFWTDYCLPPYVPIPLVSRVFSDRGKGKHPINTIWLDESWSEAGDPKGQYSTAVLPDGRFATTHTRMHTKPNDLSGFCWVHQGGVLGKMEGNLPEPTTALFEYTPPYGADTISNKQRPTQTPAVACNNDRIVWVYSRLNPDTIFEAYALITDWNMVGIPVTLPPSSDLKVVSSIGPTVTLRYSNCPNGFRASVYDAGGRKVDEIQSPATSGMIQWGGERGGHGCYGPGVYFIVPQGLKIKPSKVVLIK